MRSGFNWEWFEKCFPKTLTLDWRQYIEKVCQILDKDPILACRMLTQELGLCRVSRASSRWVYMFIWTNMRYVSALFGIRSLRNKNWCIHHVQDIIRTAQQQKNIRNYYITNSHAETSWSFCLWILTLVNLFLFVHSLLLLT